MVALGPGAVGALPGQVVRRALPGHRGARAGLRAAAPRLGRPRDAGARRSSRCARRRGRRRCDPRRSAGRERLRETLREVAARDPDLAEPRAARRGRAPPGGRPRALPRRGRPRRQRLRAGAHRAELRLPGRGPRGRARARARRARRPAAAAGRIDRVDVDPSGRRAQVIDYKDREGDRGRPVGARRQLPGGDLPARGDGAARAASRPGRSTSRCRGPTGAGAA